MNKDERKRFPLIFYILAAVTVCWFILITYLSHQSDTSSNDNSLKLTNDIIVLTETVGGTREERLEEDLTYSGTFNLILRDVAHVGAFGGLSFFMLLTLYSGKLKIWPGMAFCIVWSVIDEMSKAWFAGRHAEVSDAMLNVLGAVLGILAVLVLTEIIKRCKRKGHAD